jgi:Histidine kinase-, DNA gyrase B-, and HSP90-like ATPase/TraG P-loop domain
MDGTFPRGERVNRDATFDGPGERCLSAGPAGSLCRTEVEVLLKRAGTEVEVSVFDTGEGIAPEFLPYVFDRFQQGDASTTRPHSGLGLGLAIVKQLVELRGGNVRVTECHATTTSACFLDGFAAFRDWEIQNPDEAANFLQELSEEAVVQFAKDPSTTNYVRDLAFAYFRPEQFPSHSALIEQLLFNPRGGAREREETDRVGKLLRAWSRDGEKGRLFDGVSNIRIDGRVAHFELGQIPEHATEMRAAANFLVANYGRQKIVTMPRSVPKIAIFEEAARTLEIPGGVRMIQEYYRQMRKFGCNILAVVQQYDILKTSEVRGAMIGNSKMFFVTSQQSRDDAKEIGAALGLSDKSVETIHSYPLPELMDPKERFSAFTYVANDKIRRLVGTVKNVASRELLYAASSDNETFDSRAASLGSYQNIVTGIIQESEKLLCASEESATEPIL